MDYNNTTTEVYGTNSYTEPAANPNNGMAIGSLVCGILGILSCCCCGVGAIFGIIGVILAIVSKGKNGGKFSGLAVAGMVCSILAILSGVGYLIYAFVVGVAAPEALEEYNDIYNSTYYNY